MRLTEEQKIIVEKNHNLIYHFCHKYNLNIDSYYDVFAISLCKAAINYDSSRGTRFSTFAIHIMYNDLKCTYRENTRKGKKDVKFTSLDSLILNHHGEDFTLNDVLSTELNAQDEIILTDFKNIWDDKEKQIVKLLYQGYTQKEIGRILNYSQSQISKYIKRMKEKAKK